jgi:hypothetical protein
MGPDRRQRPGATEAGDSRAARAPCGSMGGAHVAAMWADPGRWGPAVGEESREGENGRWAPGGG